MFILYIQKPCATNTMKVIKEWFIDAEWGKIAIISWGNPLGEPVLLMHGRQDSAVTFCPLLGLLPDVYHYVGFDLPAHGMSDGFPVGVAITRFLNVVALDAVIEHLGWEHFTFIGHSMGTELGLFYNAIYPNVIKKFILFDPGASLQRLMIQNFPTFYATYNNYYENYSKINSDNPVYSRDNALKAVMKARGTNRTQAELILSRNLKKIGEDQYRMSWDRRTRLMPPTNYPPEYYFELFSKNCPPTLCLNATNSLDFYAAGKETVHKLMADFEKTMKNFTIIRVEGNHDFHFLHPERISEHVSSFLGKDFGGAKSKL